MTEKELKTTRKSKQSYRPAHPRRQHISESMHLPTLLLIARTVFLLDRRQTVTLTRRQTDTQTHKVTDATDHCSHASATAGVQGKTN